MPKQETKTLLDECGVGSTTGDSVTTTTEYGSITFVGWVTLEEGAELGANDAVVQGSVDGTVWMDLVEFDFTALEASDSVMITDGYRYYRAVTGTLTEGNLVSIVAHCKGISK